MSVDCVIFGLDHESLKVLLIKSDYPLYEGKWSLLGDLVTKNEAINQAADRVLFERTGLQNLFLEQVLCFGNVNRHPSGRVVSVAYYTLVNINHINLAVQDHELHWHSIHQVGNMAFDHNEILNTCLIRLQERIKAEPIGFNLLPEKFSMRSLQLLYESVLMVDLDRRNFRKKVMGTGLLIDMKELESDVPHRPAKLFKFNSEKYRQQDIKGNFV
ncbi:MAG TPA: NUDIX domain-containing protein [Saprospiraceae bacterium]|nr:NUDIX domain-containing protein [Saprospiraceae bacterium]